MLDLAVINVYIDIKYDIPFIICWGKSRMENFLV